MLWRRRGRFQTAHLRDEQLLDIILPAPNSSDCSAQGARASADHLLACSACNERLSGFKTFLDDMTQEHLAEFNDVFSVEDLTRQRASIRRKLDRMTGLPRAVRLLRFPGRAITPALGRTRTARWWLAASVTAGLLTGVSLGQFLHVHPGSTESFEPVIVDSAARDLASKAAQPLPNESAIEGDVQAFMNQVESMLLGPDISELRPLDTITPGVREAALSPW